VNRGGEEEEEESYLAQWRSGHGGRCAVVAEAVAEVVAGLSRQ